MQELIATAEDDFGQDREAVIDHYIVELILRHLSMLSLSHCDANDLSLKQCCGLDYRLRSAERRDLQKV